MPTTFQVPLDDVFSTVATGGYTSGAGVLNVAAGTGSRFGSTFPVAVTVITAATVGTDSEVKTTYRITARTTDALTIGAVLIGSDQNFAAGARVECRINAKHLSDVSTAVNALENAGYGTGTVTSVALSLPSIITVSGSPITTTGTLTGTLANQNANVVFAGPASGSAAAPTMRALVALDLPNHSTDLLTSGTLGTTRGGTGLASIGTANQVLRVNSGATALEFATMSATVTIGGAVGGSPTSGSLLYTDASGNLAQTAQLKWDVAGSDLVVSSASTGLNNTLILIDHTGATGQPRFKINTANTGSGNVGVVYQTSATDRIGFFGVVNGSFMDFGVYDFQSAVYPLYVRGNTGRTGIGVGTAPGGMLHVQARDTSTQTTILQAIASQATTSRLLQIQNSAGSEIGWIDPAANVSFAAVTCGAITSTGTFALTGSITGVTNITAANFITNSNTIISAFQLAKGATDTNIFNFRRIAGGGTFTQNTGLIEWNFMNGDTSRISAGVSSGTFGFVGVGGTWNETTAVTVSSTATFRAQSITTNIGNGTMTFTGSNPLSLLYIAPTINLASGTTGRVAPVHLNPTYTAVGTGMIPPTILVQDAGTDRFLVDRHGRIYASTPAPGIAAGTGAGTTPTVTLGGNQSDHSGIVNVTTGTTPATTATVATITFSNAFPVAPKVVLYPANAATRALSGNADVVIDTANTTTTAFVITSGSTALAASTAYRWIYHVL